MVLGNPPPAGRRRAAAVGRASGHRAGRRHDGRSVRRRSARRPRVRPRGVRRERLDGGDAGGVVAVGEPPLAPPKGGESAAADDRDCVHRERGMRLYRARAALCDLVEPRAASGCRHYRRHDFARAVVPAAARCRDRRRADAVQRGRRPPRRRALAMPHDRPGRPHVAARRGHQRHLRDGASRAGDRALSRDLRRHRARASALWPAERVRQHDSRRRGDQHGARAGDDRNRPPTGTGRAAGRGVRRAHSIRGASTPMSAAAAWSTTRHSCKAAA